MGRFDTGLEIFYIINFFSLKIVRVKIKGKKLVIVIYLLNYKGYFL